MAKPRIAQRPPRLTPLAGRASPKGSHNFGGTGKGIDMPNKSSAKAPSLSPFGNSAPSPGGLPMDNFCKGGKVKSSRTF